RPLVPASAQAALAAAAAMRRRRRGRARAERVPVPVLSLLARRMSVLGFDLERFLGEDRLGGAQPSLFGACAEDRGRERIFDAAFELFGHLFTRRGAEREREFRR